MLDYTQKNRNKIPDDREFFKNTPYNELKRTDGSRAYSKRELYVLNALGGGEWLLDIRLALSSKEIIDKIERVIKSTILKKYLGSNNLLVNSEVKKKLAIMHM